MYPMYSKESFLKMKDLKRKPENANIEIKITKGKLTIDGVVIYKRYIFIWKFKLETEIDVIINI